MKRNNNNNNVILKIPESIMRIYFAGILVAAITGVILIFNQSIKLQSIGFSVLGGVIVGSLAFAGTLVSRSTREDERLLRENKGVGSQQADRE